jgi:phosphoglycolate phosphatase
VPAALRTLRERGLRQVILSASKQTQLEDQLARLGLAGEFEEVLGLDNIHARSKKALAVAWKERNPHARPLFLGDTEHDADVADAIGAPCILWAGGHQDTARLSALGKPVITSLSELETYL